MDVAMLLIFTQLADWICFGWLDLDPASRITQSLHFFIEDTTKIAALLVIIIYLIGLARASLNTEAVRDYLQGKHRLIGYPLGAFFGAVTPFCSCSSIPLFMGFVSARIPLGVTMAFLLTSPLINEVAIILLGSLLGLKFTLIYLTVGLTLGMLGGLLLDALKAERWLQPFLANQYAKKASNVLPQTSQSQTAVNWADRHQFAKRETLDIVVRIWKWVILGVGIGAFIHGFIPEQWLTQQLGDGQWWSVPIATLVAIPMYANATAIIPVMETLLNKGVPVGTTLAFCMSAVAVSLPEFMMLSQVMTQRLLGIVFVYLLVSFSLVGWLFNSLPF
jgi:uncharacterized membrane protein YraQ (UPF0718 family)